MRLVSRHTKYAFIFLHLFIFSDDFPAARQAGAFSKESEHGENILSFATLHVFSSARVFGETSDLSDVVQQLYIILQIHVI
jgi:hypothetical protein